MNSIREFEVSVDNRTLSCLEAGDTHGFPVFAFAGTPGSKLIKASTIEDAVRKGIRLISYSRPGYGDSTQNPGRSVASAVVDVNAIAVELGLNKILVWGISGGGPHALACAALLPELVSAVVTLASPAPYDLFGSDWMAGMGKDNIIEFNAALEGRESIKKFVNEATPGMLNANPEDMVKAMKSLLCPADAAVIDLNLATYLANSCKEGISKAGDGWIDDDIAFTTSWNFKLNQIQVPLLLMHGEQDQMIPFSHGKWLASQIPGAKTKFLTEDGHLTLGKRIPEAHDWLLSTWSE